MCVNSWQYVGLRTATIQILRVMLCLRSFCWRGSVSLLYGGGVGSRVIFSVNTMTCSDFLCLLKKKFHNSDTRRGGRLFCEHPLWLTVIFNILWQLLWLLYLVKKHDNSFFECSIRILFCVGRTIISAFSVPVHGVLSVIDWLLVEGTSLHVE